MKYKVTLDTEELTTIEADKETVYIVRSYEIYNDKEIPVLERDFSIKKEALDFKKELEKYNKSVENIQE